MKGPHLLQALAAVLVLAAHITAPVVVGGSFVELPTTAPLDKFGTQKPNADRLRLLAGLIVGSDANGNLYEPPPGVVQLEARTSRILYQSSSGARSTTTSSDVRTR